MYNSTNENKGNIMKFDKKAVDLWYECQQNLVKAQSRFANDQELLKEIEETIYKNYYNSIDLENKNREKRKFLEEILQIKEEITQNYKIPDDCEDNREQLGRWRILYHDINRKIKECQERFVTKMSADIIVEYENELKTLNCLKQEVQSNIDNFTFITNKLTKELAIEYSKNKPTFNWSDSECESHNDICSWFIRCIAKDMYTENEILEIAKLIKG